MHLFPFIRYKVDKEATLDFINIFYSVTLTILATSAFYILNGKVIFHFTQHNYLLLTCATLYFLFDWFSAYLVNELRKGITHSALFFIIIGVIYLGYTIILCMDENAYRFFVLFSIYSLIVPLWDISLYNQIRPVLSVIQQTTFLLITFLPRFAIGIMLFLLTGIQQIINKPEYKNDAKIILVFLVSLYVFVKFIRYNVLANIVLQQHKRNKFGQI